MNCRLSRLCRYVNYIPFIGTAKSLIDLIIALSDGESDEAVEALIALVVGLTTDYLSSGMYKSTFDAMRGTGQLFTATVEEVAKKITKDMAGQQMKEIAQKTFLEAFEGLLISSAKEMTELAFKEQAINATKIAAKHLLINEVRKSIANKGLAITALNLISNNNITIEAGVERFQHIFRAFFPIN
jgi:hypothetical protein